jgi:hypothetical protein
VDRPGQSRDEGAGQANFQPTGNDESMK